MHVKRKQMQRFSNLLKVVICRVWLLLATSTSGDSTIVASLMASFAETAQPSIVIGQRSREASSHGKGRCCPKHGITERHGTLGQVVVYHILRNLHGDHGYEAHADSGLCCPQPGESITPEAKKKSLQRYGSR